jgi:hypothetical protein
MAYPLLGTLTKADFQSKLITGLEPDRKNPVEAVSPYVLDGTVDAGVAEQRYAVKVTPEGEVTLHSHMVFDEQARTAIVSPYVENSSTVRYLGKLTANGQSLPLFPNSTVQLCFPLVALGAALPFLYFFHVKTEWQMVVDGLQG